MNLDKFNYDMNIISKLSDNPTQTAEELKKKFDEGGLAIQLFINNMVEKLNNAIWPIGSIYISIKDVDPASIFGGRWVRIADTFLLAAGETYKAGDMGGEATHVLTVEEMPSHWHEDMAYLNGNRVRISLYQGNVNYGSGWNVLSNSDYVDEREYKDGDLYTASIGGDREHNNMPPYLVVYMWQRVE